MAIQLNLDDDEEDGRNRIGRTLQCSSLLQWRKQDQILKTKTKTTGSKQRHLMD